MSIPNRYNKKTVYCSVPTHAWLYYLYRVLGMRSAWAVTYDDVLRTLMKSYFKTNPDMYKACVDFKTPNPNTNPPGTTLYRYGSRNKQAPKPQDEIKDDTTDNYDEAEPEGEEE